jgi:hypothetical protein
MIVQHVNGATRARTIALVERLGLDADTAGVVWLVHTVEPFDPARGDWLDREPDDPDAVIVVAAESIRPDRAPA